MNFGKHLFLIAAGSTNLLCEFEIYKSFVLNAQNFSVACDFSHRRNLTRHRSYHCQDIKL